MAIGIGLILIASYISLYIIKLNIWDQIPHRILGFIPYEFLVISIVFILFYFIYMIIDKIKAKKLFKEIESINNVLATFISDKTLKEVEITNYQLKSTYKLIKNFTEEYFKLEQKLRTKIRSLEDTNSNLLDILNEEEVMVCKINNIGKLVKANQKFLRFVKFESEAKFNMNIRDLKEIFTPQIEEDWSVYDNSYVKAKIGESLFLVYVKKIVSSLEYVLTFIDITEFEKEKQELERKALYFNKYLKSEKAMNKLIETTMIRVLNYENYAAHLSKGVMELFEEQFVEKIRALGYDEIFKIQNNTFAVYDLRVDFDKYKKVLEESIKVSVAGDEFIFNPKVVLGSGLNYEQAYQQVIESGYTLISKQKNDYRYPLDAIKLINRNILNDNILLGYKMIENEDNIMFIYPSIQDGITLNLLDQSMINGIAREFNLYLIMIKQVIINNLQMIKNYKIIIDVTSGDLLSTTMLVDLLLLIKREELNVVFNVDINSKYNLVLPILKQIKSFAQLSIKNVGQGYISFKDLYVLKVEYMEIDNSIIELMKTNPQWKFLLDSVKLLVSAQRTKLLAYNYSDEKVLKISDELKIYEI